MKDDREKLEKTLKMIIGLGILSILLNLINMFK